MESINVVTDDAIKNVVIDDGEGSNSKETLDKENEQEVVAIESSSEKESTPVASRMEIRSMSRSLSPLTPLEVHPSIS